MTEVDTALHDDRGSALLLIPASVLVVLAMAVMCVDFAIVHLAQREAVDAAAQAGNDVVSAAFDVDAFFASGDVLIDEGRATAAAQASVASRETAHLESLSVSDLALVDGRTAVQVQVTATVRTIFAPAVLPGWSQRTVTGTSTVRAFDSTAP